MLSKTEILAAVQSARSQIQDLSVSFSFNATHSAPDDPCFRSHDRAAAKGSKVRIERQYGGDPATGATVHTREISYDGETSTFFTKNDRSALYSDGKSHECRLADLGFFQCAILMLPPEGPNSRIDLQSLLGHPDSRLREKLDIVGGADCYVLDVGKPAPTHQWTMTVWLDPSQGFLPLQVHYSRGWGEPEMETYIDQAEETIPGLWLPLHGRKVLNIDIIEQPGRLDSKPHPNAKEYVMEVDGWRDGHPALAVNTGIKDEYFELQNDLPPETRLIKAHPPTETNICNPP